MRVNLTGAFHTIQAAAALMLPRRTGSIVLTASTNSFDGEAGLTAYNATKAGLMGLLHTAANEFGPYGIRVNAVCPGLIRTRLTEEFYAATAMIKDYFRQIPLGARRQHGRSRQCRGLSSLRSRLVHHRGPRSWWTADRWPPNSAPGTTSAPNSP